MQFSFQGIKKNGRTYLLVKNILASFLIKGWTTIVMLLMVPLTLQCLGIYKNGVWLTINSLLLWIDQMDIGLGNGLRNKLAVCIAHNDKLKAKQVVSSTAAMLLVIVIPIMIILNVLVWYTDVYSFLNVSKSILPDLRVAVSSGGTLVCMTFILKFIGNVYMGLQLPAFSNFFIAAGQTLALLLTWILYVTDNATFLNVVVVNTLSPLIIYLLAYPYTFFVRFPCLRPSHRSVERKIVYEMGNVGIKFFWIQLASILQFMTSNILISKFFSPELVTPYQISYRYMSLVVMVFSVVCMPFWNATTDAYERRDIEWIKKAGHRMNQMVMLAGLAIVFMIIVSPMVYHIWIGKSCVIGYEMTAMMGLYVFLLIASTRYSFFLNGIGVLRLQLYMTVSAVIFIPVAWAISYLTHNIIYFMAIMCVCNIPGLVSNIIQFNKIINGKAVGIWGK